MITVISRKARAATISLSLLAIVSLGACAGMSRQDQNTAIGAGVGAVGGAVLTDGSALGTLGGAAIGGVIGNQIETDDERNRRNRR